jgi:glucose/arabinose dehydrogenase
VDQVSGDRTIISGAGIGSGPAFVRPRGIAVEADGSLVVTDPDLVAVVRVDPVTGDRTIISDANTGSGP